MPGRSRWAIYEGLPLLTASTSPHGILRGKSARSNYALQVAMPFLCVIC